MPPAGRKVTRLTASGSWSDVVEKVAARTNVAKMATPSINENAIPMQMRGPAPNGM